MQEVGIKDLWYLRSVENALGNGRELKLTKFEGNWWEDDFWAAHLSVSMK